MKPTLLLLLLTLGLTLPAAQAQTTNVTVASCAGQVICVPLQGDSAFVLCVRVNVPLGHCALKSYEINWGDNQTSQFTTRVPAPTGSPTVIEHSHRYNLRSFLKNCEFEVQYNVQVETRNERCNTADTVDLNISPIKLRRAPSPKISLSGGYVCANETASFNLNTCPSGGNPTYEWDYGDGSRGSSASHRYTTPGTYPVRLKATNACGSDSSARLSVDVVGQPDAEFAPDSGAIGMSADTALICWAGGQGVIRMDGVTRSVGRDANYRWRYFLNGVDVTSTHVIFLDRTSDRSPKPKVRFTRPGNYDVQLTVENRCGSDVAKCWHKLIDVPTVRLLPKPDTCAATTYTFPTTPGAAFTLDGLAQTPGATVPLPLRATPYLIRASLTNQCGPQVVTDTVLVALPQPVRITNPATRQSTLCLGNPALPLRADQPGGTFFVNGTALLTALFDPQTNGTFTVVYRRGAGACEVSDTVRIVVQGSAANASPVTACADAAFVKLGGTPTGGTWTTSNCPTCQFTGDTLRFLGTPPASANLTYTVTAGGGTCPTSKTVRLSVGVPKAAFTLPDSCVGSRVTPVNASTGAGEFRWFFEPSTTPVSTDRAPLLTLPGGAFTLRLEAWSGSCTNTVSLTRTPPRPPEALSVTASQVLGCAPMPVTFTPGGTARPDVTYTWTFGDGSAPFTGFSPPVRLFQNTGSGNRTFTAQVLAKNGCGEQRSAPLAVTVRPRVVASIGADSTLIRCAPTRVKFSNRSTGHQRELSRWDFGDGSPVLTTGADTLSHPFVAPRDSARTYRVRLIVSNACGSDTAALSVRVFPNRVAALFSYPSYTVCPGETVLFRDGTTPQAVSWFWRFGDGSVSSQPNPAHRFTRPNTTFTVTMVASTPCGSDSIPHTIRVGAAPKADFQPETPYACQGQSITLRNTTNPADATGFRWNFADGSPVDSSNFSPRHAFAGARSYPVQLTVYRDRPGCRDSIVKNVEVRARPKANFRLDGDSLLCAPGPVRLVSTGTGAERLLWQFSNGERAEGPNPSLPFQRGSYGLTLTALNGVCRDSLTRSAVFEVKDCQLLIPEAFTPGNADGYSDFYTVFGEGMDVKRLRVFGRWGEVLFDRPDLPLNDQRAGWDGTFGGQPMPAGQYVVEAQVEFLGGRRETRREVIQLRR